MTPCLFRSTGLLVASLLALCAASAFGAAPSVQLSVLPAQPLIEQGKHDQVLNLDFRIDNRTTDKIELSMIEVSVLGADDVLLAQFRVGGNGGSIEVVPQRTIEPGQSVLIFNPLHRFPEELELKRLRFDFSFDAGDESDRYRQSVIVRPRVSTSKLTLQLPVAGTVLVHDAHDFYGHHRRLNLLDPMAKALGWTRNFMRYSYDFVVTDAQGRMYSGDGSRNEDWFGWGTPVSAPAAGKVIRAVDGIVDNQKGTRPPFTRDQFIADPSLMWGNHIEIDHGNGEISMLAHMRKGSLRVKVGDNVDAGAIVGAMGFSGDAFLVHLHYDLKSAPGFDADGLPSPFNNFERRTGADWLKVKRGQVDSGDVVRRVQ